MKIREELGEEVTLLRRWVLVSGRDVIATTRDSFVSIEGRAGISVFVGLWILGRLGAGDWNVWGPEWGGEILPMVRTWYSGEMALFQALLLGAHIFVGVLWGVIVKNGWGLVGHFWPKTAAERLRTWVVGSLTGLLILVLHLGLLVRDLARHPALYQETFLDRGGLACWIQQFAIEKGGGWGEKGMVLLAGTLVVGAIARLIQRLVVWFLEFSRPTRVAIGVLGGAVVLFACGIRFVAWTQAGQNDGPNMLFISVDGLRGDSLGKREKGDPPALARLIRRARVFGRTVPPTVDLTPTLVTALTGRSPLTHGIRHDFPSAQDTLGTIDSLPARLRAAGWCTTVVADGPGSFLDRWGNAFDISRVASSDLRWRLARRQWERSPHLLPYLSGRVGRSIPLLRGSPFLADPALLAREAVDILGELKGKSKFFLWVHFSSPGPMSTLVSPRAAAHGRPALFRRPGEGLTERPLTDTERVLVRQLYSENVIDLKDALELLFQALADRRMEGNTAVILWSPRATLLSAEEEQEALALKGPAFFDLPFLAVPATPGGGGVGFQVWDGLWTWRPRWHSFWVWSFPRGGKEPP